MTSSATPPAMPAADPQGSGEQAAPARAPMRMPGRRRLLILSVIVLLPLILWLAHLWAERVALTSIEEQASQKITLFIANLRSELDKYEYLPQVLARDENLIELLQDPRNPALVKRVNRRLEAINSDAQASDTYVMSANGTTLAASNWQKQISFVGQNFKFRPYYQIAMQGGQGRYFALGTTSLKPGYYLSHAVYDADDDAVLGVIVVKVSVQDLESAWASGPIRVMVSDPNGVILITTEPDWKFRTMTPLPSELHRAIIASRQYHTAPLDPLPVVRREVRDTGHTLMTIRDAGTFMVQTAPIPKTAWKIHALSPTTQITSLQYATMAAAGGAFVIILLLVLYVAQRRLRLSERLAYQRDLAATLERANAELETRVDKRTADLSAVMPSCFPSSRPGAG